MLAHKYTHIHMLSPCYLDGVAWIYTGVSVCVCVCFRRVLFLSPVILLPGARWLIHHPQIELFSRTQRLILAQNLQG